ncbi:MAG: GNAT family N-acetyltransferase [Ectothiorhodospiraceae bacterium]|nr:GNAT family N-acetyltransferase [Ectothiorhodospiraceae bacterium]
MTADADDRLSAGRLFAALRASLAARGHRALLHLAGPAGWTRGLARLAWEEGCEAGYWLGETAEHVPDAVMPPASARRLLGQEADLLVYDTRAGLDPDALGAVSGTLRGGGLLLLLTPPAQEWPDFPDPERERITVDGYAPDSLSTRYLTRFLRLLREDRTVIRLTPGCIPEHDVSAGDGPRWQVRGTEDQRQAVDAVCKVATGHRRRPLVLPAARGRGKSAALGMAVAALCRLRPGQVVVTAPRESAVAAVFRHAGAAAVAVRYLPPDQLLDSRPDADLVLVAEAAGLPVDMLARLLEQYSRIVFSSTVHGYEGSGRGFALRFNRLLDAKTPQWRRLELRQPIRWAPDDPLEPLLFRTLLMDAATPEAGEAMLDELRLEWLDRATLAGDESLLRQVFGLLVQSHYRTRPFDLRNLLDGPNLHLALARSGTTVLGAMLVAEEGGFEPDVAEAVWLGHRRPHGHLLPQSLANHAGVRRAAEYRMGRVMRIAVHPAVQGRMVGSRLLGLLPTWADGRGLRLLGSSFGASAELLRFWARAGYLPVRLGPRRDPASGAHAVLVLRAPTGEAEAVYREARDRFAEGLPVHLQDSLQRLEPELLWELLAACPVQELMRDADWQDVLSFTDGARDFETCLPALRRLSWHMLPRMAAADRPLQPVLPLLLRVLQGRDWQASARALSVSGRAGVVAAVQQSARVCASRE